MTMPLPPDPPRDWKTHWEAVYRAKVPTEVSWFQPRAMQSLDLIQSFLPATASMLDVGGGASSLAEDLWAAGYRKLAVLDLSAGALDYARSRLGKVGQSIYWIEGDILTTALPAATVDCWHDRALFHFLTEPGDRARYAAKVRQVVRPGGYLLIATFASDGPTRCSGLPTVRYTPEQLEQEFRQDFRIMATRRDEHRTPTGALQAFTYCLFRYEPTGSDTLPPARLPFTRALETKRLLLRPWQQGDAPHLKAAIDANLDHLRAWLPWAMHEPSPLEVVAARIARFEQDFAAGLDATYGIFARDDGRVLGGTGLHLRIAAGVEIGYWLDHRELGQGFATEASSALTAEAFRHPEVARVQIRCDPRNQRSAAVPRRLGFRHVDTLTADTHTPGGSLRDTMIWELTRADCSP